MGPGDVCRTYQGRDHRGQRRWRVPRCLLPPLLLRHRSIANQKRRRAFDKRKNFELTQSFHLPQSPRKHDRKRDLVQLNARPVWCAVDPEVLCEAAVCPLRTRQIHQRPHRSVRPPACQHCGSRLHHVARPHQVVAAQISVALRGPPRNRRRRDKRARIRLVLMRQQHVVADSHQPAAIL